VRSGTCSLCCRVCLMRCDACAWSELCREHDKAAMRHLDRRDAKLNFALPPTGKPVSVDDAFVPCVVLHTVCA
jgi:hypothetical protein